MLRTDSTLHIESYGSSSTLPIKQSSGQPQGNLTSLKQDHGFLVSGLELATWHELDFWIISSGEQKL